MRFLSLLAEPIQSGYLGVADELGWTWDRESDWRVTQSRLLRGETDLAALCGLLFTMIRGQGLPIRPLASAVLAHPRYQDRPIYFVDVVARESLEFEELSGRVLAVNDWDSLSGYHALRAHLHERGLCESWFGERRLTGSHRLSLQSLRARTADYACFDSTFWDFLDEPERRGLKVCFSLGPYPAPLLASVGHPSLEIDWTQVSTRPPFARLQPVGIRDYQPVVSLWQASQSL